MGASGVSQEVGGKVIFRLRKDMPKGFKSNKQYPELPVILSYLSPFEGKEFDNFSAFKKQVLDEFLPYLKTMDVSEGADPKLREGLASNARDPVFYAEGGDLWDYEVFTPATNGPGKCVFGGLEKIS